MKKMKQIVGILMIGILLITACDNREEVEEISPCNYSFTATPETAEFLIGSTEPVAITLDITRESKLSCNSKYTMSYTVIKENEELNDLFTYTGEVENVAIGKTSGTFSATEIGTYTIKITITNTEADRKEEQTQTITIEVIYPPIIVEITDSPSDNEVFVKKNATYTVNLSGGNPNNNVYNVTLTAAGEDIMPRITAGGAYVLGTLVTNVPSNFGFVIKPNAVGTAVYTLTVEQDGVTEAKEFTLTSKPPEFDIALRFRYYVPYPNDIDNPAITLNASNTNYKTLKIEIENFTSGYYGTQMHYTYSIAEGDFISTEHPYNPTSASRGYPIPSLAFRYRIRGKPDGNGGYLTGVKEIKVTVRNTEYGYSKTGSIWINIR